MLFIKQVYAVSSAEESDGGSKTPTIGGETSPKPPVPTPDPDFVTPVAESPVEEVAITSNALSVSNTSNPSASTENSSEQQSQQPQRRPTSLWKSFSLKKLKGTFASQKETTISNSNPKLDNIAGSPTTPPDCDAEESKLILPQVPTPTEVESPTTSTAELITEEAIDALESSLNGEVDTAESSETERQMDTLPVPPPRSRRKTPTPTPTDDSEDINKLLSRPKDLPLFETAVTKERKISLQQLPKRKKNDLRKTNPTVPSSSLGGLMKKKFSKF